MEKTLEEWYEELKKTNDSTVNLQPNLTAQDNLQNQTIAPQLPAEVTIAKIEIEKPNLEAIDCFELFAISKEIQDKIIALVPLIHKKEEQNKETITVLSGELKAIYTRMGILIGKIK